MTVKSLAAVLPCLLIISACGVRGPLDTPPPMWGDPNRAPSRSPEPFASDVEDTPEVILPNTNPLDPNAQAPSFTSPTMEAEVTPAPQTPEPQAPAPAEDDPSVSPLTDPETPPAE